MASEARRWRNSLFTVKTVNCNARLVNDSLVWVGSIQWIGLNGLNRFVIQTDSFGQFMRGLNHLTRCKTITRYTKHKHAGYIGILWYYKTTVNWKRAWNAWRFPVMKKIFINISMQFVNDSGKRIFQTIIVKINDREQHLI